MTHRNTSEVSCARTAQLHASPQNGASSKLEVMALVHIELAGGGHYNAAVLRSKVAEIQKQIPAGVDIRLNSLYINPRQFTFQLPLRQEMCKEGLPIEGFCIAAGIPNTEKDVEIINGLKAAGIRYVAFKLESIDGIRQVVNIAAANPDFPIILQWTGGRAGGHHSFDGFLFASRVMIANEVHTSSSVKDLIVAATGLDIKICVQ